MTRARTWMTWTKRVTELWAAAVFFFKKRICRGGRGYKGRLGISDHFSAKMEGCFRRIAEDVERLRVRLGEFARDVVNVRLEDVNIDMVNLIMNTFAPDGKPFRLDEIGTRRANDLMHRVLLSLNGLMALAFLPSEAGLGSCVHTVRALDLSDAPDATSTMTAHIFGTGTVQMACSQPSVDQLSRVFTAMLLAIQEFRDIARRLSAAQIDALLASDAPVSAIADEIGVGASAEDVQRRIVIRHSDVYLGVMNIGARIAFAIPTPPDGIYLSLLDEKLRAAGVNSAYDPEKKSGPKILKAVFPLDFAGNVYGDGALPATRIDQRAKLTTVIVYRSGKIKTSTSACVLNAVKPLADVMRTVDGLAIRLLNRPAPRTPAKMVAAARAEDADVQPIVVATPRTVFSFLKTARLSQGAMQLARDVADAMRDAEDSGDDDDDGFGPLEEFDMPPPLPDPTPAPLRW